MMFIAWWRRPRNRNPVPSRGCRHPGYRPRLEPLEGRELPALWDGGLLALAAVPGVVKPLPPLADNPPGGTTPVCVTVSQNAPESVIDLGSVFGAGSGTPPRDGLKLAVLGNTNSALVQTDLSEAALTLTYAPGRCGTATITVGATNADGVSVQQSLLVTVQPLGPTGPVGVAPFPAAGMTR